MARSNYSFKKRQKELSRKKKKEEKLQRRLEKKNIEEENDGVEPQDDTTLNETKDF